MAQETQYFGLAFFDVGDNLADLVNVELEMERFVIIDRQLYGLYSIFGSGVISGWEVLTPDTQQAGNISVEVSPGLGIVNLMAAETTYSTEVDSLPANQVGYIFAQVTAQTPTTLGVRFFYSNAQFATNAILLATVVTTDNGIVSIDNTVRTEIGFQRVIDDQIRLHHHRGSPTKIDLAEETKGRLPGNKIGDVSAEIVKRGKFTPDRLPLIDHDSLFGIGLFSHPEIDTMLRKVVADTDEQRLIEITIANTLKEHLFLKYKYNDCDEFFINELLFIPGISPSTWVDWDITNANVNLATNCISGKPVHGGQTINVRWATKEAFNEAKQITNVVVTNTGVTLQRGDLETLLVEGFESAQDGGVIPTFTANVEAVDSETGVTADGSVKTEEQFSGKFTVQQTNQGTFVRTFDTPQNWTEWDRLSLSVKCTTASHGAVYMYLVNAAGEKSSVFQLLAANEVTTNADPALAGFEDRTMVLSGFINRDTVTQLVVVVEDVINDYGFWLDDIRLRKSQSYVAQGNIRLRYDSAERVIFNSIVYDAILPSGTDVKARVRVADSEADLDTALFSTFLRSADVFVLRGKWIEVDVQLFSNTLQTYTPILTDLELGLTVAAADNGFVVETADQWSKGTTSNITFIESGTALQVRTPITVGDYVFLNQETVNEISAAKMPVFGIGNQNLPISEWQAYDALFDANVSPSLNNPMSVVRTNDRRYIVCDTDNHRILIFDQDGVLLRGFCGANVDVVASQDDVIGVTATYNKDSGVLWLGFTKQITLTADSFNKITVSIGAKQIVLSEEGQIITNNGPVTGRVIPVLLTPEHQSLLNFTSDTCTVVYNTNFAAGFNKLFENKYVKMYFGPVSYHDFIYYPVYAAESKTKVNKFWICNATKLPFIGKTNTEPTTPATRQLQLFDPDEDTGIFTNSVYFMKEFGGMVYEYDDGTTLVAGADQQRVGNIYLNPLGNAPFTVYTSPTGNYPNSLDVDLDGNLWVAESSLNKRGGRVLKMDLKGNISASFGEFYTIINSIQCLQDGNLLLGT